jgi:hypothetical protein
VPTFFTDRDLAKQFPLILEVAGISVQPHHRHFRHDTEDEVWIREVARRGWIALTHNDRIRYTPNQVQAVFESGLALLILVGHATTRDLADNFVATRSRVDAFLERHQPPYIAKVYRAGPGAPAGAAGRIEMWRSKRP